MIRGCAGEVTGEMEESDCGRVVLLGKRIGDTNGLDNVSYAYRKGRLRLTNNVVERFQRVYRLFHTYLAKASWRGSPQVCTEHTEESASK